MRTGVHFVSRSLLAVSVMNMGLSVALARDDALLAAATAAQPAVVQTLEKLKVAAPMLLGRRRMARQPSKVWACRVSAFTAIKQSM